MTRLGANYSQQGVNPMRLPCCSVTALRYSPSYTLGSRRGCGHEFKREVLVGQLEYGWRDIPATCATKSSRGSWN